jgi:hypothetical protein
MSRVGLVVGPGSVSVPVHVDLADLRAALIASRHPLASAPEWTGQAIYMALIYVPVLISHGAGPTHEVGERVDRIVHVTARDAAAPTTCSDVVKEVRDLVRQLTKTKVVDESIHVFRIACNGGHKKVSDIQTES